MSQDFACYYKTCPMAFVKQLILMKHFRQHLLFRCHHCHVLRLNFKSKTSFSFCCRQRCVFILQWPWFWTLKEKFSIQTRKKGKNKAIFHIWCIKEKDLQSIVYFVIYNYRFQTYFLYYSILYLNKIHKRTIR